MVYDEQCLRSARRREGGTKSGERWDGRAIQRLGGKVEKREEGGDQGTYTVQIVLQLRGGLRKTGDRSGGKAESGSKVNPFG